MEGELGFRPELVAEDAWIAPSATVIGHTELGARSSVWFGSVLRGDSDIIRVGDETNIQDLCCLHADPGYPCLIGRRVTVGHGAIVHGAVVEDECLIGIRSVILTGAKIGRHSIIGAGAVVVEGQEIPPRSIVLGVPGRVIREVTDEDLRRIERGWSHYCEEAARYAAEFG
ncbi:MAG: gamma carbonic anhydrase family protein [Planctomycetota bacterium]|nr:MAG: gamma carbonic anhydrase family protein [Planctomycetota bacterium]